MSVFNEFGNGGVRRYGFNKNTQGSFQGNPYAVSDQFTRIPSVPYKPETPKRAASEVHPRSASLGPTPAPRGIYQTQDAEIQKLLDQIRSKEAEIEKLKFVPTPASQPQQSGVPDGGRQYSRNDFEEMKQSIVNNEFSRDLSQQVSYHEAQKHLEKQKLGIEYGKRMEDLKRVRAEQEAEFERGRQLRLKYRQELDQQRQAKHAIVRDDSYLEQRAYEVGLEDIARNMPSNAVPTSQTYMYGPNGAPLGFSPNLRFTKTMNKTLCYDPITGAMKDTSVFLPNNIRAPVDLPKYQSSVTGPTKQQINFNQQYVGNPAFQQPKYTYSNPKVVPTNPIMGTTNRYPEQALGEDDIRQSFYKDEYGGRRLMNPQQLVEYGNMAIRTSAS